MSLPHNHNIGYQEQQKTLGILYPVATAVPHGVPGQEYADRYQMMRQGGYNSRKSK